MPNSKLRKALGAVKDQTSLGLAKVYNNASVPDIAILKATTHDEYPTDERYITEVLQLVESSKAYSAACVQSLTKRIGKTRNWVVALKSLILVLKIFQNGDPHFPCEVFHAMKQGAKILNLSGFRDDSNSNPWDYTAFVRTYALYLDERLECFLSGKLQKRFTLKGGREGPSNITNNNRRANDMKPAMLLDRISYWQRLIDRIIATRPTGAAKTNRLVQISLYIIVQESFDLYRDISDELALILDSFFHLQFQSCVSAYQTCVKASKQFQELGEFYAFCKSIGVGRTSEYPSVQKISDELVETLQEFLKDQSSFPSNGFIKSPSNGLSMSNLPPPSPHSSPPQPPATTCSKDPDSSSPVREEEGEVYDPGENLSERDSDLGFPRTLSESELSFSPYHEGSNSTENINFPDTFPENEEDQEKQHHKFESSEWNSTGSGTDYWDLVLAEITTSPLTSTATTDLLNTQDHHFNPFLQDPDALTCTTNAEVAPTFTATPTFCAGNAANVEVEEEDDPFGPMSPAPMGDEKMFDGSINLENVLQEQQLWLQHQNKIIAKNMF